MEREPRFSGGVGSPGYFDGEFICSSGGHGQIFLILNATVMLYNNVIPLAGYPCAVLLSSSPQLHASPQPLH